MCALGSSCAEVSTKAEPGIIVGGASIAALNFRVHTDLEGQQNMINRSMESRGRIGAESKEAADNDCEEHSFAKSKRIAWPQLSHYIDHAADKHGADACSQVSSV